MPSVKIFWRGLPISMATLVAVCGSPAQAQEKAFDPATVEFQHSGQAARKPMRRAKKSSAASAKSPAPVQREEANPSAWSGAYGGLNAGAATGDEKNGR